MLYYHRGTWLSIRQGWLHCTVYVSFHKGVIINLSVFLSFSLSLSRCVHEQILDTHDNYFRNWAEARDDCHTRPQGHILILVLYYYKIYSH